MLLMPRSEEYYIKYEEKKEVILIVQELVRAVYTQKIITGR